jgi:hypothetical protein
MAPANLYVVLSLVWLAIIFGGLIFFVVTA